MHAILGDLYFWRILGAGLLFMLLFPSVSFLLNRRWCKGELVIVRNEIMLLATLVFVLAIICEATLNPLYESLFGEKLWVYRVFPLHDGNVSALAALVWTSYGVHLYFLNQSLDRWLGDNPRRNYLKAMLIGAEAPLVWEVLGNGCFLLTVGEFYAYYLPGELFHFTSVRVIPLYMLCIYLGLQVYEHLRTRALGWEWPAGFFASGTVILGLG
jgi:hypothetical protein